MRLATLALLLASALVAEVVNSQWQPKQETENQNYAMEATATSNHPGAMQLFYDDGLGYSEARTSRFIIKTAGLPTKFRLAIPPGDYRSIRLDPIDCEGKVTLDGVRITGPRGETVVRFKPEEFKAAHQIRTMVREQDKLTITTEPGGRDPQLVIDFTTPLNLPRDFHVRFKDLNLPVGLIIFAVVAVTGIFLSRLATVQARLERVVGWTKRNPRWTLVGGAVLAAILSSYPVVFGGKSFVSPNGGTTLLYGKFPTLPGPGSDDMLDTKGSDVGAIIWQHVPYSHIQRRALAGGELPLWNRYTFGGSPLLGQGQSMWGDPLQFLPIAFNGAAWAWDAKFVIAKMLLALGLGLAVWEITKSPGASLLIAVAAPFIGFFIYRINHPAIFSLCHAPWVLLAWLKIAHATRPRAALGGAGLLLLANCCLMTSGTIKEAYAMLLCLNFSGACHLLAGQAPVAVRLRQAGIAAGSLVIFAGMTLPLWGTFFHTLENAHTAYASPVAYQIQPTLLLGAFDELFFRPLSSRAYIYNPSVNLLVGAGLVYFLVARGTAAESRAVSALFASSLLPLALVFGLVPTAWIVQLPLLKNIWHIDNSFFCALIIQWTVLAGVGLAMALARREPGAGKSRLQRLAVAVGVIAGCWAAYFQVISKQVIFATFTNLQAEIPAFLWAYLAGGFAAVILLFWSLQETACEGRLRVRTAVTAGLCLIVLLWRFALHEADFGDINYSLHPKERADFHGESAAVKFLQEQDRKEPMRHFGLRGNLFPGWGAVYGLESPGGVDALSSKYLHELVDHVDGWRDQIEVEPGTVGQFRPMLDMLNVGHYVSLPGDETVASGGLEPEVKLDLTVQKSPTVWPRAFFTDRVYGYEQAANFIELVNAAKGRPFAAVQTSSAIRVKAVMRATDVVEERVLTPAKDYRLTENSTAFTINASGPGLVVLTETYWEGDFRVLVDGRKAEIIRANHAFKAVEITQAGEHRIEFRYLPESFPIYKTVSELAWVVVGGILVVAWVGRRKPEREWVRVEVAG